jgi:ParB-like chromosome segregation protein Spo0J
VSKTATVLIPKALQPLLLPISKLTEYPKNAQKHTPEDVQAFRKVLREFGWTNPIVAWGKNGTTYISAGHLRYNAAKAEGLTDVPVLVRRDWTERQFRAYTIADNQWTRRATSDLTLLKDELVDLDDGQFDLTLTGFERNEVYALVHMFDAQGAETQPRLDQKKPVTCPQCGASFVPA